MCAPMLFRKATPESQTIWKHCLATNIKTSQLYLIVSSTSNGSVTPRNCCWIEVAITFSGYQGHNHTTRCFANLQNCWNSELPPTGRPLCASVLASLQLQLFLAGGTKMRSWENHETGILKVPCTYWSTAFVMICWVNAWIMSGSGGYS